jgi:hypothetical protein
MGTAQEITIYLAAGLAAAIVGTLVAGSKRRSQGFWMVACLLFPPALIVLLLLPKGHAAFNRRPESDAPDVLDNRDL